MNTRSSNANENTKPIETSTTMQLLVLLPKLKQMLSPSFVPYSKSVIIGKCKEARQAPGSCRLRACIISKVEAYKSAGKRLDKSMIVTEILDQQQRQCPKGGAFVKHDGTCWWELSEHDARENITAYFRNRIHDQYTSSSKHKSARRRSRQKKKAASERCHQQETVRPKSRTMLNKANTSTITTSSPTPSQQSATIIDAQESTKRKESNDCCSPTRMPEHTSSMLGSANSSFSSSSSSSPCCTDWYTRQTAEDDDAFNHRSSSSSCHNNSLPGVPTELWMAAPARSRRVSGTASSCSSSSQLQAFNHDVDDVLFSASLLIEPSSWGGKIGQQEEDIIESGNSSSMADRLLEPVDPSIFEGSPPEEEEAAAAAAPSSYTSFLPPPLLLSTSSGWSVSRMMLSPERTTTTEAGE